MTQVIHPLYPLNDLTLQVTLKKVLSPSGATAPLEVADGTPTAFLATSNSPTATAADATFNATVVYTGAGGKWLVSFDAAALTAALLATHFAAATPYLIVQLPGGFRVYIELAYFASRPATVT